MEMTFCQRVRPQASLLETHPSPLGMFEKGSSQNRGVTLFTDEKAAVNCRSFEEGTRGRQENKAGVEGEKAYQDSGAGHRSSTPLQCMRSHKTGFFSGCQCHRLQCTETKGSTPLHLHSLESVRKGLSHTHFSLITQQPRSLTQTYIVQLEIQKRSLACATSPAFPARHSAPLLNESCDSQNFAHWSGFGHTVPKMSRVTLPNGSRSFGPDLQSLHRLYFPFHVAKCTHIMQYGGQSKSVFPIYTIVTLMYLQRKKRTCKSSSPLSLSQSA